MIILLNVTPWQYYYPRYLLLADRSYLFQSADPASSLLSEPPERPGEADYNSRHRALGAGGLSPLDVATTVFRYSFALYQLQATHPRPRRLQIRPIQCDPSTFAGHCL